MANCGLNGWKLLEMVGMAEQGGLWLEWLDMAGNGWTLLNWLKLAYNGLKWLVTGRYG